MRYAILVLSPPNGCGSRLAVEFVRSTIARGHSVGCVFFLDEGVSAGLATAVYPQDESSPHAAWRELATQHSVELTVCVSSALAKGVLDEGEAQRYEQPAATLQQGFSIAGLGDLVHACENSDRLVTFGG